MEGEEKIVASPRRKSLPVVGSEGIAVLAVPLGWLQSNPTPATLGS